MLTLFIAAALIVIFVIFVWSYPSHYAPSWRDFIVAFAVALLFLATFYSMFLGYSLGRTGLVVLASITVSAFWGTLLAMAWVQRLAKIAGRKKERVREPVNQHSIPDVARQDVWRRDKGRCVRCGSEERIEFVHIIPLSRGGTHQPNNLQLLCRRCHQFKRVKERLDSSANSPEDTTLA